MTQDFHGKVALITGAGGGIGRALTQRLSAMGFRLALLGRSLDKLRAAAEAAGQREGALLMTGDLTDPAFLQGVIGRVVKNFGGLDVLVNNAGICFVKDMEKTGYDEFDAMMRTNVYAPYLLCRDAIAPLRRSDCATILNIGSVVSHKGYPTQSAYATAKHALLGMTKALAAEVYRDGIRVHIICPGAVNTDMARTVSRPDIDMNALIGVEDIADVAEFLLTHRGNAVIDEVQLHRIGKQPF
ncbi:MAG: SDR family NAD(P)-dependent oxidoreductase [Aristaeellaceae bacterium]|nr:SDR family oxidoreductase [Eubacteriales bacterium]